MYLPNKYTRWYRNIIANAQSRVNYIGYIEKHHIIPKSLGGSNESSNLVNLTPKEHFICHLLLVKMTDGKNKTKMRYAVWMLTKHNKMQSRVKITGRRFQKLKDQLSIANKERTGPNLGKPMSSDTKLKLSASLTGKSKSVRTAEHNAKLGKYVRTDEHREILSNMRKSLKGTYSHSVETKSKISNRLAGIPKPKVACEHCGKECSIMNYQRWHRYNCKQLK